jgi:coenzyme F420 hydrogenase subunit beta
MMNDVVDYGSCCECGACVVACPHNVIEYIDGKPKQTAKESASFDFCGVSEGAGCDVCATVCPRLWPREEHLKQSVFGTHSDYEDIFGVFKHIFVAKTKRPEVAEVGQDGGVVTGLLSWALGAEEIDGAVVSAVGEDDAPCFPSPKVVTSQDEVVSSAGSWYTYCPNNRALPEVAERDLKKVAFVGVPCQITPIRKMEVMDPAFLVGPKKKPKIITRQREFLRGYADRVSFSVGLFCTEVFRPELMTEKIEQEMSIPLSEVSKFNVKGEVLVYKKDGDVATIPLEEAMQDYQRPECAHCGDFSAEMADIACGGVGTDNATIVVIRTEKGENIWKEYEKSGLVEVEPISNNKRAWNILLRLARRQRERVPSGPERSGTSTQVIQYDRGEAILDMQVALREAISDREVLDERLKAAYQEEDSNKKSIIYIAGQEIPNDPGTLLASGKRKLPPPLGIEEGGSSPL